LGLSSEHEAKERTWQAGPVSTSSNGNPPAGQAVQIPILVREKINLRFPGLLTAGLLLAVTSWYWFHRFQVRNHAAALIQQADVAEGNQANRSRGSAS